MIGKRIEEAVKASGKTESEVAAYAGMSLANLYKLYKKEDIKSLYLKKISEILDKPFNYFLYDNVEDERATYTTRQNGSIAAGRDIRAKKIIPADTPGIGSPSSEVNLEKLQYELALCQNNNTALAKEVALKDEIIGLLKKSLESS